MFEGYVLRSFLSVDGGHAAQAIEAVVVAQCDLFQIRVTVFDCPCPESVVAISQQLFQVVLACHVFFLYSFKDSVFENLRVYHQIPRMN